jgi:hypothetical protein
MAMMSATSEVAVRLLFIDFEASSLSEDGFPIEVAWCNADGEGESHLIRPAPGWTCWRYESELVHHISRERILVDGEDAAAIAHHAAAALSTRGTVILSDACGRDQRWLDRLLSAGGMCAPISLSDMWRAIVSGATERLHAAGLPDHAVPYALYAALEYAKLADNARGPTAHRALPDAQRNAAIWRDVVRHTEAVAALWQVRKR